MATVRQVRRSLLLVMWFVLSGIKAWPMRLIGNRPAGGLRVQDAVMLRLPSPGANLGLEVGLKPPQIRLLRIADKPIASNLNPGAFVSRLPASQDQKPGPDLHCYAVGACTTVTRTHTVTKCTEPPPPVPPPTTVQGTTGGHTAPLCTRTTTNEVCVRVLDTYECKEKECCWSDDKVLFCETLSEYTIRLGGTTYTTITTFPTFTTCGSDARKPTKGDVIHHCYY
jgi:hypothetical protein